MRLSPLAREASSPEDRKVLPAIESPREPSVPLVKRSSSALLARMATLGSHRSSMPMKYSAAENAEKSPSRQCSRSSEEADQPQPESPPPLSSKRSSTGLQSDTESVSAAEAISERGPRMSRWTRRRGSAAEESVSGKRESVMNRISRTARRSVLGKPRVEKQASPLDNLSDEQHAALQRLYDLQALKPDDPPARQMRYLERVMKTKQDAEERQVGKAPSPQTAARRALARPWANAERVPSQIKSGRSTEIKSARSAERSARSERRSR